MTNVDTTDDMTSGCCFEPEYCPCFLFDPWSSQNKFGTRPGPGRCYTPSPPHINFQKLETRAVNRPGRCFTVRGKAPKEVEHYGISKQISKNWFQSQIDPFFLYTRHKKKTSTNTEKTVCDLHWPLISQSSIPRPLRQWKFRSRSMMHSNQN